MALFLRKLQKKPNKILVTRTDRIGDFVLTLPVLEALHKGGIEPSVLCRTMVTPLLENNPFVDRIITVDEPGSDPIEQIRACGFESLLVLVNDPIIRRLLPRLKHIPVRIGPLSKPAAFFSYTHPVLQKRSRSLMNEAEYNLELLEIFGLKPHNPSRPRLYFRENEIQVFRSEQPGILGEDRGEPLIVYHQGMGGSALNWSQKNYQILLNGLLDSGYRVVLTGNGKEEAEHNDQLIKLLKPAYPGFLFNLTGALSLRQLSLLIHLSDLFVGPSTGPTHLANAVGTEIISFYPPIQVQSTRRWSPYLSSSTLYTPDVPCGQKYKCIREKCPHFYCMDNIAPNEVLKLVQEIIPGRQT
ncbi:MAG: glycosyltransferase family 9 protein [Deltaproteobacteria bacterium]|jgi:ADP-heptose:LPS heptosyltransferase|nr:glycosyltransferase family 9 protein [Deltaproteobacteria bacterium]MBT4090158.1 glycosyltransferase family 9 protein [Deltaproteobacteria bacterium]MBT4265782.1 glycosyltransferase family 9 protein [Deltaproteobacteria bacterium]MBT4638331.1 glycosyltransferase family 9 protein [Deltaproteobacteria bacterium]MBT6499655.1 glycosyltransferase family 9 protein [Deltaproteobacteria bacterium]